MLDWFRKLMPREGSFFVLFTRHIETVVSAAEALRRLLAGGDNVDECCREIIRLEREADAITREVLLAVRRTFITPFDRGDIKDLIESMDDAVDTMHRTVKTVTLYERRDFDPLMREMGEAIVEASRLIAEAVPLLDRIGAHAGRLNALAEAVTHIEERADDLHDRGLRDLFARYRDDPMAYLIGREIYGNLEKVVDRLEDVANEISAIVIENV